MTLLPNINRGRSPQPSERPKIKPKIGDFPLSQKESEERARKGMEKAVGSVFSSPEKSCGPVLQRRMRE